MIKLIKEHIVKFILLCCVLVLDILMIVFYCYYKNRKSTACTAEGLEGGVQLSALKSGDQILNGDEGGIGHGNGVDSTHSRSLSIWM